MSSLVIHMQIFFLLCLTTEILSQSASAQGGSFVCEKRRAEIEIDFNKGQEGCFNNFSHQKGSETRLLESLL